MKSQCQHFNSKQFARGGCALRLIAGFKGEKESLPVDVNRAQGSDFFLKLRQSLDISV